MLTDAVQKELADYLNEQGRQWASEFIAGRKNFLRSRGITASDGLVNSIEGEVKNVLQEALMTRISIAFQDHGRYIDMKTLKAADASREYIDNLMGWIEKKGLTAKMTEGYVKKRKLKQAPQNVLNAIAWGIAVKRTTKFKRRQWWNKSKSASITDLFNSVAEGLPDLIADELKKAFKTT